MGELRQRIVNHFQVRMPQAVENSVAKLNASLYGLPGGSFSYKHIDRVSDWLRTTCAYYDEDDVVHARYAKNRQIVYASEVKIELVGRELAPYV